MVIGVPKEIKRNEFRVAAVPADVAVLVRAGHKVCIEYDAGRGAGFPDTEYEAAGAQMMSHEDIYHTCDMIYKVKEIEPAEYPLLREGQIVFTYLHSNAHPDMTKELMRRNVAGIAYEDIDDENGEFPLLSPMSIMAGKGGFLAALNFSQAVHGGCGILLSRVPGCQTPQIVIIGCGWSGVGAAELAAGFGNKVTMLDVSKKAMDKAQAKLPVNVEFLMSNRENLESCLRECDVLINCILWPKTRTDHLVYRKDLALMKHGAMVVDVACDDAGAIETCHSTSHDDPIYYVDGVLHYAVDNIPSAFARTASVMLSAATLPYARKIADLGVEDALLRDKHLRRGLTTYCGSLTLLETSQKHHLPFVDPLDALHKLVSAI
ncbi:MAG: alanine dehydrogenase [Clostridiaceae bacterium]|nr:alanine dehydrogenase [Clostridiaceae bacterium]